MGGRLKSALAVNRVPTTSNIKTCNLVLKAWMRLGFSHHLYKALRSALSVYNHCKVYCAEFIGEGQGLVDNRLITLYGIPFHFFVTKGQLKWKFHFLFYYLNVLI